jgi:hypothetical protein
VRIAEIVEASATITSAAAVARVRVRSIIDKGT